MSAATDAWLSTAQQVGRVATDLREALSRLIDALVGAPARPVRLMRLTGLDKSLASRLVQATRASSDEEFLHRVPSPTGLRMLLDASREQVGPDLHRAAKSAIDRFAQLLDRLPGGRQALDARLGQSRADVRERREHMARQASFKAVSFLFGQYTQTLTTSLFVLPAADGVHVDVLEVHRRIGLQRITPGTPMVLLSVNTRPIDDASPEASYMSSIDGDPAVCEAADFLIAEASSTPLPQLRVEREGNSATVLLQDDDTTGLPRQLTTAFRIARCGHLRPESAITVLRNYMLSTPCERLVRDVLLADGLWPDAQPQVGFYLPGPSGITLPLPDPTQRHFRQLNLTAPLQVLPAGLGGHPLEGVPDQADVLNALLQRAGLGGQAFRGWRCEMAYPVPLVEMQFAFRFAGIEAR